LHHSRTRLTTGFGLFQRKVKRICGNLTALFPQFRNAGPP
jgi:hypothetical protein